MRITAPRRRGPRPAFTLVELLVVIVIIGILAALVTAAAIAGRGAARRAAIKTQISDLASALEQYKTNYGEYPPDFAGLDDTANPSNQDKAKQRVIAHLKKRFPRYTLPTALADQWTQFRNDVLYATSDLDQDGTPYYKQDGTTPNDTDDASTPPPGLDVSNLTPASAMVFWLGGLPEFTTNDDATTSKTLTGFSANPANPFESKKTTSSRIAGLAQFAESQLTLGSPVSPSIAQCPLEYHPYGLKRPYVYVRAYPNQTPPPDTTYFVGSTVQPYYNPANSKWVNPTTFQIISAGMDDGYGNITSSATPGAHFPSGDNFTADSGGGEHFDNITNFTTTTIEAEMSK